MAFDAGTAWIQILPSFNEVTKAFDKEVEKMGRKMDSVIADSIQKGFDKGAKDVNGAGEKAGKNYGSGLSKGIQQGLKDAKVDLGALVGDKDSARKSGEDAGKEAGGAFARSAKSAMAGVLRDLPEVGIDSDPTEANHKIDLLRERIETLRDAHIGVDIDEKEFLVEVAQIRAALAELQRSGDTTIELRYDIDKARATLRQFADNVGPQEGRRAGENTGGAFAESWTKKLSQAFSQVQNIRITGDTSDAEAALAHIRTELAELRDANVGVDLDEATAIAAIEDIKRRLRELSRDDSSIRVRVEAASAYAELVGIKGLEEEVDHSDPTVNVKTDGGPTAIETLKELTDAAGASSSRIGFLIAIGATIGGAIVPAAAAAAAAIGAIGVAAGAAAAGIGVGILGFSGIGGAIQAMDKYSNDADKSTASLTKSQNSAARAASGVESAERSLANTRETVAAGARRAAQAVVDAQRSVVDAERGVVLAEKSVADAKRDALRAEQDLTRAYRDAKRAQEDQVFSLKENALAQRQANLDVAASKKKLDALLANNRATAAEREAARVDYDERVLRLDELGVKQKRLTEDKAESDKKGIAGSTQVVAAQEKVQGAQDRVAAAQDKVRSAVEGVGKANQKVAEAVLAQKDQARQGAFQIASAQASVANAMRSVENAATSAGVAGGSAMRNLQQAMDQLGPAGQRFAKFLYDLKPAFLQLRDVAQAGLLPGVQQAITGLLQYLPQVTRFVSDVANSLGSLFVRFVNGFKDPTWQAFFHLIADQTVPMLEDLFAITGNVATGIAGIVVAMSRFNGPIMDGLVRATEAFSTWAANLGQSQGFQKFADYVRQAGPAVIDMLKQVGIMFFRLVEAAAPIGLTVVKAIDWLATSINSLSTGTLTKLLTGFVAFEATVLALTAIIKVGTVAIDAYKAVLLAWAFIVDKAKTAATAFSLVQYAIRDGMLTTAAASTAASTEVGVLGSAMAGLKAGVKSAGSGLSTLASMIGPGGWVTLGIGAAALGLAYYSSKADEQKERVDGLVSSLNALGDAYSKTHDLSGQSIKDVISHNDQLSELVRNNDAYGVSVDLVARATGGEVGAQQQVIAALDAKSKAVSDAETANVKAGTATKESAKATGEQLVSILNLKEGLQKQFEQVNKNADVNKKLDDSQKQVIQTNAAFRTSVDGVRVALTTANPTASQFKTALDEVGKISADAAGKAGLYALMSQRVADSNVSAADKATSFKTILDGLGSAAQTQGPTFDALSATFSNIATSELNARDKGQLLHQVFDQLYSSAMAQTDAQEAQINTTVSLRSQLAGTTEGVKNASLGFEANTATTDANRLAILANRDALEAAFHQIRAKYEADVIATGEEGRAREEHDRATKSLLDGLPAKQRTSAAVQQIGKDWGSIPDIKQTVVTTPGLDKAIEDLIDAHAITLGLSKTPHWDRSTIESEAKLLKAFVSGRTIGFADMKAEGGKIGGWSPHDKADNIPTWLTAGEWVQPVSAVDYYGHEIMEAMRQRLIPREMFNTRGRLGFADGGLTRWPIEIKHGINVPNVAELWKKWEQAQVVVDTGGWPSSPAAQRGDSGVWHKVVELIKSTGPVSGTFGNAYRPGDPLWHGSGRAVDWMGYNQDALATFLAGKRPLELIHRTNQRDYAYTRGVNKGSFNEALMEQHRNHVHIALADGGLVPKLYDNGGWLKDIGVNATGKPEAVLNQQQWGDISRLAANGAGGAPGNVNNWYFRDTTLDPARLQAIDTRQAVLARVGRSY